MNALKGPHHVALTQSAEICLGDIGAAVWLVSLLPLEITGSQESEAVSPVEVKGSDMGLWWTAPTVRNVCSNFRQLTFCLLTLLHCSSDFNECLSLGVCPEYSECINSLGSYCCSCKVGFTFKNSICESRENLIFLPSQLMESFVWWSYEVRVMILILGMIQLRLREVKSLAQRYTAIK